MFETFRMEFVTSRKMKSWLKKYWGTKHIDGVEVFEPKLYVYDINNPSLLESTNVNRITRMFGIYKSLKEANFSGLDYYYLHFNRSKWADVSELNGEVLCNKINEFIPLDEKFTVTLKVTESSAQNLYSGWSKSQVETYVRDNWGRLVDEIYMDVGVDSLTKQVVGTYVLFDTEGVFEVKTVNATVVASPVTMYEAAQFSTDDKRLVQGFTTSLALELEVTRKEEFTVESVMYQKMQEEKNQNLVRLQSTVSTIDEDYENGLAILNRGEVINGGVTDEIWYKGHLRVETTDSNYLRRNDFTKLLSNVLDSGQVPTPVKKKGGFLGFIIAVVVIIAAILLAPVTAGMSVAAAAAAYGAALGVAALVLTGLSYLAAKNGYAGAAQMMGKMAMFTGIASVMAGVGSAISSMAQASARQAAVSAGQSAAQGAVQQHTISSVMNAAMEYVKNAMVEMTSSWTRMLSTASKVVDQVTSRLHQNKVKKFSAEIGGLEGEIKQQDKELTELTDKEYNIGVEDIKFYTEGLRDDNLQFEVDYLYEGTRMNIGRPSFVPTGLNQRVQFNERTGMYE